MAFDWTSLFSPVTSLLGMGHNAFAHERQQAQERQLAQQNMQLQRELNQQNIDFQRETNAQNEALMRESWARDDSAYTRKAQDLANAGLSQTLAAGGGAMSSSPISLKAPQATQSVQNNYSPETFSLNIANLMQMSQNFATNMREDRIANAQISKLKSDKEYTDAKTTETILHNGFFSDTAEFEKEKKRLYNFILGKQLDKFDDDLLTSESYRNNLSKRTDLLQKQLDFFDADKLEKYVTDAFKVFAKFNKDDDKNNKGGFGNWLNSAFGSIGSSPGFNYGAYGSSLGLLAFALMAGLAFAI